MVLHGAEREGRACTGPAARLCRCASPLTAACTLQPRLSGAARHAWAAANKPCLKELGSPLSRLEGERGAPRRQLRPALGHHPHRQAHPLLVEPHRLLQVALQQQHIPQAHGRCHRRSAWLSPPALPPPLCLAVTAGAATAALPGCHRRRCPRMPPPERPTAVASGLLCPASRRIKGAIFATLISTSPWAAPAKCTAAAAAAAGGDGGPPRLPRACAVNRALLAHPA